MSRIMLVFVFLGFAPSFYLKPLIGDYPFYPDGLPWPHIIHGIILTVWYVLLVLQTGFIQSNRIQIHQKLGWFGASWALLVVASTVWVIFLFPNRMIKLANQLQSTVEEVEPGLAFILWLDVFMCLLFIAFLSMAILKRNQPAIHKRLMLYTGLVFIFAATNRFAGIISHLTDLPLSMPLGLLILLVLTGSLLFHDRKTQGRILPVSWWCFGLYWVASVLSMVISNTNWGAGIVDI
ncbi:hypothetical protein FJ651_10700 [Paucihalobacter ruber]|uniref:Uncharacterized protein n=1 Tax=Paucihalobacter ruber TaxID=2567861 RepID=A0A506PG14_9FLAO|nr:hypothetical protein [Paucihalobacter ruber]TPV32776.1 hypothetical protein FJ651_10700 [Paucihalobacter ruber]